MAPGAAKAPGRAARLRRCCCCCACFLAVLLPSFSREGLYEAITGYGLGGSSIALFGRVGGGIYTKVGRRPLVGQGGGGGMGWAGWLGRVGGVGWAVAVGFGGPCWWRHLHQGEEEAPGGAWVVGVGVQSAVLAVR